MKRWYTSTIRFSWVSSAIETTARTAVNFASKHKGTIIPISGLAILIDDVRVRLAWKRDQKSLELNALKQQTIMQNHEAEIHILKEKSEQSERAVRKVDELEQIVKKLTKEGESYGKV